MCPGPEINWTLLTGCGLLLGLPCILYGSCKTWDVPRGFYGKISRGCDNVLSGTHHEISHSEIYSHEIDHVQYSPPPCETETDGRMGIVCSDDAVLDTHPHHWQSVQMCLSCIVSGTSDTAHKRLTRGSG